MDKFSVDYSYLEKQVEGKQVFKLSDVKDRIEKVAFDVVRFKDSDDEKIAGLWQIQSCDDGEFIVAMYEEPKDKPIEVSSWKVASDTSGRHLSIFYKNTPIAKVAAASLGVPQDEVSLVCRYLPKLLETNKNLVSSLLVDLPRSQRESITEKYPELIER